MIASAYAAVPKEREVEHTAARQIQTWGRVIDVVRGLRQALPRRALVGANARDYEQVALCFRNATSRYRPYGTMIVLDRCYDLAVHRDTKVTHWRDYIDPLAVFDALEWPSP